MGGGKVTRPDFNIAQADKSNPLTEFYLLLQKALDGADFFCLPGEYVRFSPPADEKIYADEIRQYCKFSNSGDKDFIEIFAPYKLNLLYNELRVDASGVPAALMLADEQTHKLTAVQIIPPVVFDALPVVPDCSAAISLALSFDDMALIDTDSAALGKDMIVRVSNKMWLHHPRTDKWLQEALFLQQKAVDRRKRSF